MRPTGNSASPDTSQDALPDSLRFASIHRADHARHHQVVGFAGIDKPAAKDQDHPTVGTGLQQVPQIGQAPGGSRLLGHHHRIHPTCIDVGK